MRRYNFMLVAAGATIGAYITHILMMMPLLYAIFLFVGLGLALPFVVWVFTNFIKGMPKE